MTNHHALDDDQLSREQLTFPYLLTLDSDTEQLRDEPVEELTPAKESEKHPPEPMATRVLHTTKGTTKITRANSAPNLTTADFTITTSSTAYTPITVNTNLESTNPTNETLDKLRNQLTEAQKEIVDLRRIVRQSEIRAREHGLRMLTMENTLRQLMLLHPTIQSANLSTGNLTPPTTQPSASTKRTLGENLDSNLSQPQAKRTKTVKADVTDSKREQGYTGNKPYCSKCNHHHKGPCSTPCEKCQLFGHRTKNCKFPAIGANSNASKVCFECGDTGHFRNGCPQLRMKNNNPGSATGTSYTTTSNFLRLSVEFSSRYNITSHSKL